MTAATAPSTPGRPPRRIFSRSLYRVEILRQLRNIYTLVFTLVTPVAMYLIFGSFMGYGADRMAQGNVAFFIMVSLAAFGTATAMSSLCSLAASEVRQGWGRQIAMTQLPVAGYAFTKLMAALTFSAIAVAAVFIAGFVTGAEATGGISRWLAAAAIAMGVGVIYGLWGMGVGMLLNPDSAAALAAIAITFFGFLGNVFMPLDGAMLEVARFTPIYGYVGLVRWPVSGGELVTGGSDPVWLLLLNVVAWTGIFLALAYAGVIRSRRRR